MELTKQDKINAVLDKLHLALEGISPETILCAYIFKTSEAITEMDLNKEGEIEYIDSFVKYVKSIAKLFEDEQK